MSLLSKRPCATGRGFFTIDAIGEFYPDEWEHDHVSVSSEGDDDVAEVASDYSDAVEDDVEVPSEEVQEYYIPTQKELFYLKLHRDSRQGQNLVAFPSGTDHELVPEYLHYFPPFKLTFGDVCYEVVVCSYLTPDEIMSGEIGTFDFFYP